MSRHRWYAEQRSADVSLEVLSVLCASSESGLILALARFLRGVPNGGTEPYGLPLAHGYVGN